METRLGRDITEEDFKSEEIPCNESWLKEKTGSYSKGFLDNFPEAHKHNWTEDFPNYKNMKRILITGGIGAGKSYISRIFEEKLFIPVFDSDKEAKKLMSNNLSIIEEVKAEYGEDIYVNAKLDRKKLADIIFNDKTKLDYIGDIIRPKLLETFNTWCLEKQHTAEYCLFETAAKMDTNYMDWGFNGRIVVAAPEKLRIERVMKRDDTPELFVRLRMNNQESQEDMVKNAVHVIHNDGSDVIDQIKKLNKKLKE